MGILRVREAFSILSDPTGYVYTPGQLLDTEKHAAVIKKAPRGSLEPIEEFVSARAGVEQATAEPGEKRSLARPAKKAAPKSGGES